MFFYLDVEKQEEFWQKDQAAKSAASALSALLIFQIPAYQPHLCEKDSLINPRDT